MSTEFGNDDYSGGSASGYGGYTVGIKATVFYTCPGSGVQVVDYFKAYCRHSSDSGNIRLAIYTTDLSTLIGESEATAVNSANAQWWELSPSGTINLKLNLNYLAFEMENTEYEPEQFPGLVYKLIEPNATFLLFTNGKLVCTGTKNRKQLEFSMDLLLKNVKAILKDYKK